MNIEYKEGKLTIDLCALLDGMPQEEKLQLVETLSCEDVVIKHVAEQIIDRWTESGQHGLMQCQPTATPSTPLDKAWREVAKRSGDVAKLEVERLEHALLTKEKHVEQLNQHIADMNYSR